MDPLPYSYLPAHFCVCSGCPTRKNRAGTSEEYEVFCFNPNEDIGTIASSRGWDQAKQEKKWLQVYNTVVAEGQKKNAVKRGTGIVTSCGTEILRKTRTRRGVLLKKILRGWCVRTRAASPLPQPAYRENTALPGRKCPGRRVVRRFTGWIQSGRWNVGL